MNSSCEIIFAAPESISLSRRSTSSSQAESTSAAETPPTVTIAVGSHQIEVKKKGFAIWTRTLSVTGGAIRLNAELDPEPAKP